MNNLPISGPFEITATYGQTGPYWKNGHKGIDIVANDLTIYSTCTGTVRVVDYDQNGWGYYVSIGDTDGDRHIFCHLEKGSIKVKPGDKVTDLTVIGTMGATGNVTGRHLHYQINDRNNIPIDPTPYLGIPNKRGFYNNVHNSTKDAETVPEWAREAVEYVKNAGLMVGDDTGNFRPNDPITRAEMAVILARLNKE